MKDWSGFFEFVRTRGGAARLGDGWPFGISDDSLRRRARREGWEHPIPGAPVVLIPGADKDELRTAVWASLRAVDGDVWVARDTAAHLVGFKSLDPRPIQLLVPHHRRLKDTAVYQVGCTRRFRHDEVTEFDGIPLTIPARTIRDIAEKHNRGLVRSMIIAFERNGVMQRAEITLQRERMWRGCTGAVVLDQALADLAGTSMDSNFEWKLREFVTAMGFKIYPAPFPYRCHDGVIVHLDIVIDGVWVCIEGDGFGVHTQDGVFTTDRIRWNQITHDWTVVWVDEVRLANDPMGIVRDIRLAIAKRKGEPAPVPAPCGCRHCLTAAV